MYPKPDIAWGGVYVGERGDWDFQEVSGDENVFIIRKTWIKQCHTRSSALVCV